MAAAVHSWAVRASYQWLKCDLFLLKSLRRASVRIGRLGLLIPRLGAFLCRWVGLSPCRSVWGSF